MLRIIKSKADVWAALGLYLALLFVDYFSSTQSNSITLDIVIWIALVLVTALLTFLVTGIFAKSAKKRFVDIPNERSSHQKPTPRGGGIAFAWIFVIGSGAAASRIWSLDFPFFILQFPLLMLIAVGFYDDRGHVSARIRYLVQIGAAAFSVPYGMVPILPFDVEGVMAVLVAMVINIIFVTAFINFYNFMDGLDGLVASVSFIQLTFLSLYLNHPVFILLAAALLGFLPWNWSPAKIFMGDVGSTFLGAVVAIFLIGGSSPDPFSIPLSPMVFWSAIAVTFPLMGDATYTIIRRLLRRENIFKAHRFHLYQRLNQSGWSHAQVALTYSGLTGIIALLVMQFDLWGSAIAAFLTLGCIVGAEMYLHNSENL